VAIGKNDDALTVLLRIECVGACSAGDTNQVQVYGQSDPRWYPGGIGPKCGSTDCLTDTSPPSSSSNVTNTVSIFLTARTGGAHTVACDSASNSGSNEMFHGITYQWGYDLTNTGWNDDTYTFTTSVNNGDITDWTFNAGLSNKALTGQSDTSSTAVHSAEASMEIKPSDSARPGVYKLGLQVTGTSSGIVEGCEFNVVIKQPDLEVKDTDISFSHSSAWINSRGDSQRVTITAMVRNNGGIVDTEGVKVENIEVIFLVDGSQLGTVVKIDSLAYGEEKPVSVTWNPGRAHDSNEVGIPIKVSVDPSFDIQESDADNNIASTHFKVVKTKASNPSFYMSFLSLVGAVGAAVLMSAYYRNKDEE
ncbi:MAG: CARDB domain-containing protein, partial [Candidatus Thermoplasmatota archaeon]|nr:CARDB domain-containing protein [Candidatus Thermoplasmatota archaeon]